MTTATMDRDARKPNVRTLTTRDVISALKRGLRDFTSAPVYGLFFGGVYALAGWVMYAFLTLIDLPFLVYPLFIGFAIIAPFVATGLYHVSRSIEEKEPLSWRAVFASVRGASRRDTGWAALITGFAMIIWMDIAALLFFGFMGLHSFSAREIAVQVFTTPVGLIFLSLGTLTGAAISFFVFSITAISFPLLYDREVDFVTAMITSVKVVRANPRAMIAWYLMIAVLLSLSLFTFMAGLFLTLPILGHATWHLYRSALD